MSSDSFTEKSRWRCYRDRYRSITALFGDQPVASPLTGSTLTGTGTDGAEPITSDAGVSESPRTAALLRNPTMRRHLAAAMRVPEHSVDAAVTKRAVNEVAAAAVAGSAGGGQSYDEVYGYI